MGMDAKIRKLMELANHPGTGAAEAATAAAMASELALKYNIDMDAAAKPTDAPKNFERGSPVTSAIPRDKQAHGIIAGAVARMYGCKTYINVAHNKNEIYFVGRQHNVAMANTWQKYLWDACVRSNKEFHKTTRVDGGAKEKYKADLSFRLHFCNEVANRLQEKLNSMKSRGVGGTGTALMVVNWYEQERKEVQEWIDATTGGNERPSRTRAKAGHVLGAMAGYKAGRNLGLDDQLAHAAAQKRLK